MRHLLALLLALHGAIHLIGVVHAFGLARVDALTAPIPRPIGLLWLVAAVLLVAAGAMLLAGARDWWLVAGAGALLSQALIVAAWRDARWGTLANLVVAVPLLVLLAERRPGGLRARYAAEARAALALPATAAGAAVTARDLAALPAPVARWMRRIGVVGRPRPRAFHAVFRAEMRSGPDAPWMPATADQVERFHPARRLFFMHATRGPIPFDVYHRYVGDAATMEVRAAGLVPVGADHDGAAMTRSETVTLLNDVCVFAPGALLDPAFAWTAIDDRTARVAFSNAGHTVRATLHFDAHGDLVDFTSDDRAMAEGRTMRPLRWRTPLAGHRDVGGVRLPARAEARWVDGVRDWAYGRFVLERLTYDAAAEAEFAVVPAPPAGRTALAGAAR